jgi:hypothetical protein
MPVKIPVNGAGKGGNDFVLEQSFAEAMVESLQQQRAVYVERDDTAHVKTIDQQIAYYSGSDAPRSEGYEYVDAPAPSVEAVGCGVLECVLVHPHERPAITSGMDARDAGLVLDRATKAWREPR